MGDVPRICELCDGTGYVSVYHPLDVRAVKEGCNGFMHPNGSRIKAGVRENGSHINALCAVPCKCSRGDAHALWFDSRNKAEPIKMPRFGDSVNHVRPQRRPGGVRDLVADVEESMQPVEWDF